MFSVCSHCQRHVRLEDARCPFCGHAQRNHGCTSAGALFVVALGAAVAIGCGGETETNEGAGGTAPAGGSANVGGSSQGGSVNRGGATSYPSGGLMVPYGLPPMGGMTAVAEYGPPPLGGAGGMTAVAEYGPPPLGGAGGTVSAGGGSANVGGGSANVGGGSANVGGSGQGGSVNRGGATNYPSGGLMVPYGLPPSGGMTAVPVYGAAPLGGATNTGGTNDAGKANAGNAGVSQATGNGGVMTVYGLPPSS